MADWLIVDTNNLCHRAFHSTGRQDAKQSILEMFREVEGLAERFGTQGRICWCFDYPPYFRSELFKGYKIKHPKPGEIGFKDDLMAELKRFRVEYLPELGFVNVFHRKGYESDDLSAAIINGLPDETRGILVSGDWDVLQLLNKRCAVYQPIPKDFITAKIFKHRFGIHPRLWSEVKSIVGCVSDTIPGITGVGEKTALKFFRGELKGTSRHDEILAFNKTEEYRRNRKLIVLPWEGLVPITPIQDNADSDWGKLAKIIGLDLGTRVIDSRRAWG